LDEDSTVAAEATFISRGLWPSYILTLAEAEAVCRQRIPPQAVAWAPQGNRIVVVRDPTPEKIGSVYLTDNQRDVEIMHSGVIIAVGPTAGLETYQGPAGNVRCSHPKDLLGKHITFGYAAGKAQRYSIYDHEYDTSVVMLTPFDVWSVDTREDWFDSQAEFEEAYKLTKQAQDDAAEESLREARRELIESREG